MFYDISESIRLRFDYESKAIIIQEKEVPIPGFHGFWVEKATIKSEEVWYKSSYAKMIEGSDLEDGALWFWIDMQEGLVK